MLTHTLPSTLQQFGVPADQIQAKVDEGIPLLINAIKELLNDEHLAARSLKQRDSLDKSGKLFIEYGCDVLISASLPLFIAAATDFGLGNSGGKFYPRTKTENAEIF